MPTKYKSKEEKFARIKALKRSLNPGVYTKPHLHAKDFDVNP